MVSVRGSQLPSAIVALRSVIQQVRTTLVREARDLVGADLIVQSTRPWPEDVRTRLAGYLNTSPVVERMEAVETSTMAAAGERAQLVELRGIEEGFPYYGTLQLQSGRPWSSQLLRGHGLVVQPELQGSETRSRWRARPSRFAMWSPAIACRGAAHSRLARACTSISLTCAPPPSSRSGAARPISGICGYRLKANWNR